MEGDHAVDRRTYLTTAGAAGATALAGCIADGEDPGDIVAGTAPGFPPFEFVEDGELVGFDVDLIEAVVASTDYGFGGWKHLEFASLVTALTDGQIDLIAAALTIDEERRETIAFSNPYFEVDQSVLVADDGAVDPDEEADLEGHSVGAQRGTTGEAEVERLVEAGIVAEADHRVYDDYTTAVGNLVDGALDVVVIDLPVAWYFGSRRAVRVAFVIETDEEYGFGLRRDDDERIEAVDDGLGEVRADGTYEELHAKWFGDGG